MSTEAETAAAAGSKMYPTADDGSSESSSEDKKSSEDSSDLLDTVKSQPAVAAEEPTAPLLTEPGQHFLSGLAADSSSEPTTSPTNSPVEEKEYFLTSKRPAEEDEASFNAPFQGKQTIFPFQNTIDYPEMGQLF